MNSLFTKISQLFRALNADDCSFLDTQAFRPIEMKLLSTENVDLLSPVDQVLMKSTGEIVFVRQVEKESDQFLYFCTLQKSTKQSEPLDKKKIKWPCDSGHKNNLHFLLIQILWKEYLVISCKLCKDIKLVSLETLEMASAFSDDQPLGKMSKGWHKIYVETSFGLVELDCSSNQVY